MSKHDNQPILFDGTPTGEVYRSNLPIREQAIDLIDMLVKSELHQVILCNSDGRAVLRGANIRTYGGYKPGIWQVGFLGEQAGGIYFEGDTGQFQDSWFNLVSKSLEFVKKANKITGRNASEDDYFFKVL